MVFLNFKNFINPYGWVQNIGLISKLKLMLKCIALMLIIQLLGIIVRMSFDSFGLQYRVENKILGDTNLDYFRIFIIVLYLPIYEELAFRLALINTKLRLVVSFSLISAIMIKISIVQFLELTILSYFQYFFWEIIALSISVVCVIFFFNLLKNEITNWIESNYNIFLFLSVFIWAFLHINNFDVTFGALPIHLYNLIQFFIIGFIFSYVRVKNGLIWALGLHIAYNSIVTF